MNELEFLKQLWKKAWTNARIGKENLNDEEIIRQMALKSFLSPATLYRIKNAKAAKFNQATLNKLVMYLALPNCSNFDAFKESVVREGGLVAGDEKEENGPQMNTESQSKLLDDIAAKFLALAVNEKTKFSFTFEMTGLGK